MDFQRLAQAEYSAFHGFMTAYYREGEDKETPQAEIDTFIQYLFDKIATEEIHGALAYTDLQLMGVVLWMNDTSDSSFSQMPGYGTILEMGVLPAYRKMGYGRQIAVYAEQQMIKDKVKGYYLCAYGPSQQFWESCGYVATGKLAFNGLPLYEKPLSQLL